MKTIRELEQTLGVSKVSIYAMLKKDEFKGHVVKNEKNVTLVDDIGESLLKNYYNREQEEANEEIVDKELSNDTELNKDCKEDKQLNNIDIIRILEDQIKIKDKQLNDRAEEVKTLLKVIEDHQKLQGVQLLKDSQYIDEPIPETIHPEKKGFWKRLFG